MPTTIRDITSADYDLLLRINNAAAPNVNELTADQFADLHAMSAYARLAQFDGRVAGFLLALMPGQDYDSINYRWFCEHYESFVYIDRVVVGKKFRGLGIGNVFYADVQSFAEQRAPMLLCEVNLVPRNDTSLIFHGARGFTEVGQQSTEGGDKRVSLLAKPLPAYEFVKEHYCA